MGIDLVSIPNCDGQKLSNSLKLESVCLLRPGSTRDISLIRTAKFTVHDAQSEEMSNSSSISHFLLLPLADTRQLQLLHFCLFLGISLAALLANGLIISTVACGHLLHTPMFFFLLNLALTDLGSICTTVPKAMHNSLWDTTTISYEGCAAQLFLIVFFISAGYFLLTVMCYDHYVSICKPLPTGPSWAAELVPTWQQLPGPVPFSMLCCTQPIHFPCPCARAMLWASSSVKSHTSSSSPAPNPTSGTWASCCWCLFNFWPFCFLLCADLQGRAEDPLSRDGIKPFPPASLTWLWSPCLSELQPLPT
ncbi:putative olfactory receptor 10D4 [Hirundo rustica]|uniref:putative olfactory receptor 10D4 n=1 Tax=Hirundo rustica TaxID=43150 RepID=UPI0026726EBB|nr:putative olfactory receptor 10D4 [Hirundo rustica]